MRGIFAVVLALGLGAGQAVPIGMTAGGRGFMGSMMGRERHMPGGRASGMRSMADIPEDTNNAVDSETQTEPVGMWEYLSMSLQMDTPATTTPTNQDWIDAVHDVQTECAADFDAICGTIGQHQDSMMGDRHGKDHHHHGMHGMMDGHKGGHGHHHRRRRLQEGVLAGGPLGFGSAVADKCLLDHSDELSPDCSDAIDVAQGIYVQLDDPPKPPRHDQEGGDEGDEEDEPHHHHSAIMGLLCFIFIVSCCACMCIIPRHSGCCHAKLFLETLADNPELKQAMEEASGTPIPLPDWRHKIRAAMDANPDLRCAVKEAMKDTRRKPEHMQARRRFWMITALLGLFFVMVLFAPFMIFPALVLGLLILGVLQCKKCCCRSATPPPAPTSAVVYANVPVIPSTKVESYAPPPLKSEV